MDYIDSYYSHTVSPGEVRPALEGDIATEVCVVGGGLAGLATALGLRERGVDVVPARVPASRLGRIGTQRRLRRQRLLAAPGAAHQ